MNRLTVMDGSGDTEFKWDPDKPEEVATMEATVQTLKQQGFVFYLVDGRTADVVADGNGLLLVKRLDPAEISTMPVSASAAPSRRGRRSKSESVGSEVVAHRAMQGG